MLFPLGHWFGATLSPLWQFVVHACPLFLELVPSFSLKRTGKFTFSFCYIWRLSEHYITKTIVTVGLTRERLVCGILRAAEIFPAICLNGLLWKGLCKQVISKNCRYKILCTTNQKLHPDYLIQAAGSQKLNKENERHRGKMLHIYFSIQRICTTILQTISH